MSVFGTPPLAPEQCNATLQSHRFSSQQFPVVYVVGDIHGDYEAFRACMLMTECVQEDPASGVLTWNPDVARVAVVLLGDVVDRWRAGAVRDGAVMTDPADPMRSMGEFPHEELAVLSALNALAAQAEAAGSAVFRLVGNHEMLQMEADFSHFAQSEFATPFSMGIVADDTEFERHRKMELRQTNFRHGVMHRAVSACHTKAIVQIGSTVLVHGGINSGVLRYASSRRRDLLELCNETLTTYLEGSVGDDGVDVRTLLTNAGPSRGGKAEFAGILWDDALSDGGALAECEEYTQSLLQMLNELRPPGAQPARRIAVAHCQQLFTPYRPGRLPGRVPAHVSKGTAFYTSRTTVGPSPRFVVPELPRMVGNLNYFMQGINALGDGLLWRVDVSMSRAFRSARGRAPAPRAHFFCRPSILRIEEAEGVEFEVRQWNAEI